MVAADDSFAASFGKTQGPSDDVWEVLYTARAIRRMKPDPIPDAVIYRLLDAAIRAPSGGNQQGWRFIMVRDAETRRKLGEIYRLCIGDLFASGYGQPPAGMVPTPEQVDAAERMRKSALYLGEHMQDVPLLLLACLQSGPRTNITSGSSIYPAVWNLQLAARAMGVGSTLTTVHRMRDGDVKALLGIPEGYETAALIPLGYPRGTFAAGPRQPVEQVAFMDRWDGPRPRSA